LLWEQDVAGSNPVTPTIVARPFDHVQGVFGRAASRRDGIGLPMDTGSMSSRSKSTALTEA
jgi:hypothetical protein